VRPDTWLDESSVSIRSTDEASVWSRPVGGCCWDGLSTLLTARWTTRRGVRVKEKARVSLRLDFFAALREQAFVTR